MHDLFERICRYDLAKILNNFINKEFFTLDVLNERINCFNHVSDSNVPPSLQSESIKKELIILSASEMHYLVKNLGLFVGDLITNNNNNNKHWQLCLIMCKIVCVATADAINEKIIENFEKLVDQYLTIYKKKINKLFKCNFKFKHHIILELCVHLVHSKICPVCAMKPSTSK